VEKDDKGHEKLRAKMGSDVEPTGARAIILLDVWKVQTSCGFGMPLVGPSNSGTEGGNENLESGIRNRDTMNVCASKMSRKDALGVWQKHGTSKAWID